jgi:prepilin-type N-terminal cleavage/methylation domain-containing protein
VHERAAQRGFTIVELMIVVAIIAVLAIVVIPSFMKETRRAGAQSEVHPMFSELSTRLDQYKLESSTGYEAMTACPPSASTNGTDMASAACATTAGNPWIKLRVQAPVAKLKCSYSIATDAAGTDPTVDAEWPAWGQAPPGNPATTWYFIKAICPDNEYYMASWDSKLRSKDGK